MVRGPNGPLEQVESKGANIGETGAARMRSYLYLVALEQSHFTSKFKWSSITLDLSQIIGCAPRVYYFLEWQINI